MRMLLPTLLMVFVTGGIFWLMLRSFRSKRNGETVAFQTQNLFGDVIYSADNVLYISTTRAYSPLERVQIEGLRYRGYSKLEVLKDGLRIKVRGEKPVNILLEQIEKAGSTQMRLGKATEKEGMAGFEWHSGKDLVASVFRFESAKQQDDFVAAVTEICADKNLIG